MQARLILLLAVFSATLVIVCSVMFARGINRNAVVAEYVATQKLRFNRGLYSFDGWYTPLPNLSGVNVCAEGNANAECVDAGCSNCVCPEVCKRRHKPYMMMDNQLGAGYRCTCADTLEELVADPARLDPASIPAATTTSGEAWKSADLWPGILLPPLLADAGADTLNTGAGGTYPEGSVYWTLDAKKKVFMGAEGVGAVYHCPSSGDVFVANGNESI